MVRLAHMQTHDDFSDMYSVEKGVIRPTDAAYPDSLKTILGKNAPSELYFIGNLSLLKKAGIGFCGSRNSSEKGIETAKDCAEQVAKNNSTVISGYAAGVDMSAHYVALKSGGSTIIVLPEGIEYFRIKKDLRDIWDWSRVLVLSQFKPNEIWKSYRAMTRNQIIIALSKAMVVIEAQEKGGTIEAGKSTLKLKMPLFVAQYGDMEHTPGNSILLGMGAQTIKKSKTEGRAQLSGLFNELSNNAHKSTLSQQSQLNLI